VVIKEDIMSAANTKTVMIRHATPYPAYRRAGLVLTQTAQPFEVTPEQLEALQNDPWVNIHELLVPEYK
jgi:hypothetical protein